MYIHDSTSLTPGFKRFVVSTIDALEHDRMMDVLETLTLKGYDDYICTNASIYFTREEDRTLFLLSFR